MSPRELLAYVNRNWEDGTEQEQLRQSMFDFLCRVVGANLEPYFYWPPHCTFSTDVYFDAKEQLTRLNANPSWQVTLFVSSKAPVVTFRVRRLDEAESPGSDRRWTFDPTGRVFNVARRYAQALCDEFGLQLMLPEPLMDEPLPLRFRKLDPKGAATIFSEMFSEM